MLSLINVDKDYVAGSNRVEALRGVTISFRDSEFVSVLGPSGCGKTTLLNLIGGLDRYSRGDISVNGKSTKSFKDSDWDSYRNHTIGFVFQSYNLIPHQTVLSNVELALTLTGVSRAERRKRATDVLARVGLSDQLNKKPNQMSGGQMQRVAIARALINDPDILLADEPTGALDTETSDSVMALLKEIADDRLVIMVTHNSDLAEKYSTRIVRLLDGRVVDDSNPYSPPETTYEAVRRKSGKRPSMSYFTALSLSLNNLLTKKTRTVLISFAGSIGIIGIALILSLSTGVQNFINRVEEETLSSYPITITSDSLDAEGLLESVAGKAEGDRNEREEGYLYSGEMMMEFMSLMFEQVQENDLRSFKARIDSDEKFLENITAVLYTYDMDLQIWGRDENGAPLQVNPSSVFQSMMGTTFSGETTQYISTLTDMSSAFGGRTVNVWKELMNNQALLDQQYDVVAGHWPQNYDEVVMVVSEDDVISDMTLYTLGIKPQSDLKGMFAGVATREGFEITKEKYPIEQILSLEYQMVLPTDYYEYDENTRMYRDIRDDSQKLESVIDNGLTIKVVGIVKPSAEAVVTSMQGGTLGYTKALTEYAVTRIGESEIAKTQLANPEIDVFTMLPFENVTLTWDDLMQNYMTDEQRAIVEKYVSANQSVEITSLPEEAINEFMQTQMTEQQTAMLEAFGKLDPTVRAGRPDDMFNQFMLSYIGNASVSTYKENILKLGYADIEDPAEIVIYPKSFEAKKAIESYINAYNLEMEQNGNPTGVIRYTDFIGIILSSVTMIIDAITYVLVAFVAISLIVSSIMIGVITYISVLERTKEIGILRAIGASKRDISRVFNAETLIVGFLAGAMGILVSWLLVFPVNMIIESLSGIAGMASLPWKGATLLVVISMLLTLIAGIIPSRMAARRDPVEALRSE